MQDHPTADELLEAVADYLHQQVMPNTAGQLSFHARVAGNVVQMVRRELAHEEEFLDREWEGLVRLLGPAPKPESLSGLRRAVEERNWELARRIREGEADQGEWRDAVFAHLRTVTRDKLEVANPRWAEGS
jgi:hypothetical protein